MRKGQAAMEFLMTYGWAILVVLAAIGALAYFGVLSPSRLLPSKCTLSPGFDFGDCKMTKDGLQLTIYNGLGVDTTAINLTINTTGSSDVDCDGDMYVLANGLDNGETSFFLRMCNDTTFNGGTDYEIGDRYDADVKVVYVRSGEDLSHTITGTINVKVEQ